jgi:hypothetical protein
MAGNRKKAIAKVKLELEAGIPTPAPPVGKDLGPHGLNLAEFRRQYNDATRGQKGGVDPRRCHHLRGLSFFQPRDHDPNNGPPAAQGGGSREGLRLVWSRRRGLYHQGAAKADSSDQSRRSKIVVCR